MDRWEYYVFSSDLHGKTNFTQQKVTTQEYLNQLGREGWEMVSAVKTLSNALLSDEYTFFLKRRLEVTESVDESVPNIPLAPSH